MIINIKNNNKSLIPSRLRFVNTKRVFVQLLCSFFRFTFLRSSIFKTCLLASLSCLSLLISNYLGLSHAKISSTNK